MAAPPVSDEQIREAYRVYEIGFECGLSAEESLRYSVQAIGLDDKIYLRRIFDACVRLDHQGKEVRVEQLAFMNALREADANHRTNENDLKEAYHFLSKGEKFDLVKLREACTPLGLRDRDVESMFKYLAGEEKDWISFENMQELVTEITEEQARVQALMDDKKSPKKTPV